MNDFNRELDLAIQDLHQRAGKSWGFILQWMEEESLTKTFKIFDSKENVSDGVIVRHTFEKQGIRRIVNRLNKDREKE